jgi:cell division protein FtsI/penicillin-binding protein 2
VAAAVEQGSTFKILLVAAALSSGKVPSSRRFVCNGHLDLGGPPISCWGKYGAKGHGSLDMAGMLANSCNICAAQTALALGAEGYHDFLVRCGINQDPQAGFPGEAFGYLAGPSRLRRRDLASMGFGQNVSCSALQLTSIVAGLVNDGIMMQPHIVGAAVNKDGSLFGQVAPTRERTLCSPEVSRELRSMLEGVVVNGTGKAAQIPGVRVGGKTGTAQQWDPVLKRHRSDRYLVSFIAVFPIEQPRYVIHVACDEPHHGQHGADVAAPVCQRLGKFILQQVDRTPPATPRRTQTSKPQPARPEAGSPSPKLAAAPGAARVGGL